MSIFRHFVHRVIHRIFLKRERVEGFGVWFITYHRPFRPDEAGIKFVNGEAEANAEAERLKAYGYAITKIAPTSKTRIAAFMAGTLSDSGRRLLN
jgi:hypothetical protein